MTLNVKYRIPATTSNAVDRININSDFAVTYDWNIEKRVLQDIAEARKRNDAMQLQLEEKRKLLLEKKSATPKSENLEKSDAETSTRPVKELSNKLEATNIGKQGQNTQSIKFDVLEFEQGLPPLAPWDTPATLQDDLHAIGEVLGVNKPSTNVAQIIPASPNSPKRLVTPPPVVPPKPGPLSSSPIPPIPLPPRPPSDFSSQEKQLWNEVLTMGFSSQLAERGIRHFHLDKAKVLDYVVNQPLLTQSYDSEDVELSLALFDAQLDKSRRFLEVFVQLKEMGFPREEVREALMLKDCDVDAAMEYLLQRA